MLAEAVSSALAQTGATVEVLVVDDCPAGSAEETVARFEDSRLIYLKNPEPSKGRPAIVRNLAWPRAAGTFVHFLDDDDVVPEGHYEAVKQAFSRAPDVGVVFGSVAPFGEESQLAHERAFFSRAARQAASCQRFGPQMAFAARLLFNETLLVCSAGVIRRECVAAVKGFDPDIPLMEDVDFYARTIRRFGALFMPRTSLHYRIGPSLMHRPDVQPLVLQSYKRMYANYRAEWGRFEFYGLKAFERALRAM